MRLRDLVQKFADDYISECCNGDTGVSQACLKGTGILITLILTNQTMEEWFMGLSQVREKYPEYTHLINSFADSAHKSAMYWTTKDLS